MYHIAGGRTFTGNGVFLQRSIAAFTLVKDLNAFSTTEHMNT